VADEACTTPPQLWLQLKWTKIAERQLVALAISNSFLNVGLNFEENPIIDNKVTL
jgi:hypothetical protein